MRKITEFAMYTMTFQNVASVWRAAGRSAFGTAKFPIAIPAMAAATIPEPPSPTASRYEP